ncbi:MAG: hypothetical protein AB7I36_11905 [Rhodospirillaceae bacterium]
MAIVSTENFGRSFTAVPIPPAEPRVGRAKRFDARDLRGIVLRTVTSARASGRDYMGQSRAAAAAVMSVRPDLSFGEALDAVIRLREVDTF